MTPELLIDIALSPALRMLPPKMDSLGARAMLIAIAMQESWLSHRMQVSGPARSYFQFERGGVWGVLTHMASADHAKRVCRALDIAPTAEAVHPAIQFNDVLACVFARLLLWTVPGVLPKRDEPDKGWTQYIEGWRPGKPHRGTWNECFAAGWTAVDGDA